MIEDLPQPVKPKKNIVFYPYNSLVDFLPTSKKLKSLVIFSFRI